MKTSFLNTLFLFLALTTRINKHLEKEIGEHITEQRGWHWALTSFIVDIYGVKQATTTTICQCKKPHEIVYVNNWGLPNS